MKYYRISIDFGGDLDLKGKISASLLIRKMIERLGNSYETKVNYVQDTRCEIILKADTVQDISGQLRSGHDRQHGLQGDGGAGRRLCPLGQRHRCPRRRPHHTARPGGGLHSGGI